MHFPKRLLFFFFSLFSTITMALPVTPEIETQNDTHYFSAMNLIILNLMQLYYYNRFKPNILKAGQDMIIDFKKNIAPRNQLLMIQKKSAIPLRLNSNNLKISLYKTFLNNERFASIRYESNFYYYESCSS